ncbi:DUF4383 domain-containing protein [Amycolatopsis minnesotensis]|uniref:DUF4383 domain-containing protein n=1 Tax=Amycolatopsis minnesotensis TaxID=337894 RepID=A0ABN2RZA4_9PSEU
MAHVEGARVRVAGLQPAQLLAGLLGLALLAAGIVGSVKTGFGNFAGHHDATLLGFMINPFHNVVHIVTGALGLLMALGSGLARTYGWLMFAAYGVVCVWGLMITGVVSANPVSGLGNPLDLGRSDTWLHLGLAVVGLVIAVLPARKAVRIPADAAEPVDSAGDTADAPATGTKRRHAWHGRTS